MTISIKKLIETLSADVVEGNIFKYSKGIQCKYKVSVQDEFLCSALIRMLTIRDYSKLKIKKIDFINDESIEDNFIDCLVEVEFNLKKSFIIADNQKNTNSNLWLSKDEILLMVKNNEISNMCIFKPRIIKYFENTNESLSSYVKIINYCVNELKDSEQVEDKIDELLNIFINNIPLEARIYVAELIKRDCCFILKNSITSIQNKKNILFINNDEIGYN